MKRTTIIAGVILVLLFNLNCSKNNNVTGPSNSSNNNNNTSGDGTLSATINGTSFVSGTYNPPIGVGYNEGAFAQLIHQGPPYSIQFVIDGYQNSTESYFNLGFFGSTTPKVGIVYTTTTAPITLNYFKFNAVQLVESQWATDAAHSGTLTFTKCDTVANLTSGTFSFSGKGKNANTTGDTSTVTITNGSFTNLPILRY